MDNLKEIIKSILFIAGEGIENKLLKEKLELDTKKYNKVIEELKQELSGDSGIYLIEYKDKVQLHSNPEYAEIISNALNPVREKALTKACLETIAIIAYKQPITKLEIEEIRKINSADYAITVLLENKMIEIVGRKDAVGKPFMFGTTDEFLKRFNLSQLTDLPDYEALLERIAVIKSQRYDSQLENDGLYRDFEVPDEEAFPAFLKDEENVKEIKAKEVNLLSEIDEILNNNKIKKMDFTKKEEDAV